MEVVESGLENAVGKFSSWVLDHHTIMSITKETEFIIEGTEDESTLVSSLDFTTSMFPEKSLLVSISSRNHSKCLFPDLRSLTLPTHLCMLKPLSLSRDPGSVKRLLLLRNIAQPVNLVLLFPEDLELPREGLFVN
jgi:hypothetical protein